MIWLSVLLYCILAPLNASISLVALIVLLNVTIEVFLLLLSFKDQGMIAKIMSGFKIKTNKIAINEQYESGMMIDATKK